MYVGVGEEVFKYSFEFYYFLDVIGFICMVLRWVGKMVIVIYRNLICFEVFIFFIEVDFLD